MSYFVSIACADGSFVEFSTLEQAQRYANDEMEMEGFDADEVEVIKGYRLKIRDIRSVSIIDSPLDS